MVQFGEPRVLLEQKGLHCTRPNFADLTQNRWERKPLPADADHPGGLNAGSGPRSTPLRVLIVEDQAIAAMFLSDVVQDLGHVVCAAASSVQEADAAAAAHGPDVALVDINRGRGGDGVAAPAILAARHGTARIYATAYTDPATVARASATGPLGFLAKPYSDRDIAAVLARLG